MKIAVTYDNGEIFQHFGHTETFKVYEVEDGKVVSSELIGSNGSGHGALAGLLSGRAVDVLICGGIGAGAQNALAEWGIELCAGASGGCHEKPSIEGVNVGKTCRTHYRGTFNDGTQFDSSYDRGEPLEFVCGAGMMIKGFDAAVANMKVGETVTVHLMPEEAYGQPDPRAFLTVPIARMPGTEKLEVGQQVYLQNMQGEPFPVRVSAKDAETITFDANHEMAGKELNFTIELVEVK